jgi:hypothetical protein
MRSAPAVVLDLPASPGWQAASALLGALAAGAVAASVCGHAGCGRWTSGLCIALIAMGGAVLAWRFRPPGGGGLRWDGTAWWWRPGGPRAAEHAGSLAVMIDLGRWMLLRFEASDAKTRAWLPLVASGDGSDGDVRAAVYCRALRPSDPAARRARESE